MKQIKDIKLTNTKSTSGGFDTNSYGERYLTFWWEIKSQSINNASTTIKWYLTGSGGSTTRWYYAEKFKVKINDEQVYFSTNQIQLYNGTQVASGEYTLYHDSVGNCSFSAYAEAAIYDSWVNVSGSGSWELPSIQRASQPSINTFPNNSPNFNIGDTITIHMNRASNKFTHNVYFEMGEATYTVAEGVTDNCTLDTSLSVISQSLYQLSANSKSYTNVVKVDTYNGSTKIGTKTCQYIANVTNSEPTFDVAYQDTNSTTLAITNNNQQIIRNNSTLQINFTNAEAKNYATLRRVGVVIEGVGTYAEITGTSANVNIGTLNLARDTDITVSLLDSRGFITQKTVTITVLDWVLPTAIISMNRVNNYYPETNINVDASYSSIDSKNSITIEYRIKKTTDSTWGAYNTLQDNVQSQFTADNLYEWNVQVKVSDRIGSTTYNLPLGKGIPILFIDRLLRSLGIDCFPKGSSSLEVNGKTIFDMVYPVGSIYISVNNINPSTLFGGTWESFGTGRTLVGVDTSQTEFNTVEKIGGSKYLQKHSHTLSVPQYTGQNLWGLPSYQYTYDTYQNQVRTTSEAGTGNSGNLQPYITVYMWKRTA